MKRGEGTSLVAQWLKLCAPTTGCMGSIPGWGTKIPQARQPKKKKKEEEESSELSPSLCRDEAVSTASRP